jgi:hypothetical protein
MRKVVRCALATAWLASALLVGCGSDPSTEDAGRDASLDATSVDAPGFDAPSLDAPSPDAPSLDAPLDTMPSDAPLDPADAFDAGETCDAVGDACCSEDTCGGGLVCTDDDVCAGTCGASFGEPCCVGSRCMPGLACEPDGVCRFEPCGSRIGATCCIDGPPCVAKRATRRHARLVGSALRLASHAPKRPTFRSVDAIGHGRTTLRPLRSARISRSQYDSQSGFGRSDSPIKYSSIAEAAPLPSAIAQTTSD